MRPSEKAVRTFSDGLLAACRICRAIVRKRHHRYNNGNKQTKNSVI
ncbi:hypothetical protein HMPREF9120_00353 [Neisseria sp. oral taxon 020 str. F0370]|nr:hypothetical protein HMPREF9120_00353 [Neisseria sp. oral taxon 020 str. F0370]